MRAITSTLCVSRRTGRSPLRATAQPAAAAPITPARPKSSITAPIFCSTLSCGAMFWARTRAMSPPAGTATTR